MSKLPEFKVGDAVVYPPHGVGEVTAEEAQVIGGVEIHLYVIYFVYEKMTLRIPKSRAVKVGLRHLMSKDDFSEVMDVLQKKSRSTRGMWNKRAQEYEQKINSGSVTLLAEVLRDLHKNVGDADRSYSERLIYESALDRLVNEYAISAGLEKSAARSKLTGILDTFAAA